MRYLFSSPFHLCAVVWTIVLFISACRPGDRESHKSIPEGKEVDATTTVLASLASSEKPTQGGGPSSHSAAPADGQKPALNIVFHDGGRAVAYVAETGGKAHVTYNGKAGRPYDQIGEVVLSPDGRRMAYTVRVGEKWGVVTDGEEGPHFESVGTPVFSPDSHHLVYEAQAGEKWHLVADGQGGPECPSYYSKPVFSGDSKRVLAIENTEEGGIFRLVLSDLTFKENRIVLHKGSLFVTNPQLTRLASARVEGQQQRIVEYDLARLDERGKGPLYDAVGNLAFGPDGESVAYVGERGGQRYLVWNGREEVLPAGELWGAPVIRPDRKGVGIFLGAKDGGFLHEAFFREGGPAETHEAVMDLVYSPGGQGYAYVAAQGKDWFVVVNGRKGPVFDRVVTVLFSPDGGRVVYRARKDGKRFVVVADARAETVKQHTDYEMVFPPVITPDGRSVAYGVKDGQRLIWKVEPL